MVGNRSSHIRLLHDIVSKSFLQQHAQRAGHTACLRCARRAALCGVLARVPSGENSPNREEKPATSEENSSALEPPAKQLSAVSAADKALMEKIEEDSAIIQERKAHSVSLRQPLGRDIAVRSSYV